MTNEPSTRIPPQAVELEKAVLGSILVSPESIYTSLELLEAEDFYNPTNQKIYKSMVSLFERGEPIGVLSVVEELRKTGNLNPVDDPHYLAKISIDVSSSANTEYYSRIVLEKALMRKLIVESSAIANRAFSETEDALELLDEAESKLVELSGRTDKKKVQAVKVLLNEALERYEKAHTMKDGITGVASGYKELDRLTGGFQKSELILIAGRPSMGKTAFALSIALNCNEQTPVGIFSLEMSNAQLVDRMIAATAEVDGHGLKTGRLNQADWAKVNHASAKLNNSRIWVDDSSNLSILQIRAKARKMKREHGIGLFMVDYLQLASAKAESREREIGIISAGLKSLSKEIDTPVIALAQLNRDVEKRSDKRPLLSDLRESGNLEQDADVVLLIHRPELFNPNENEGVAEILIGKQRNGIAGVTVQLQYDKHTTRFKNLYSQQDEPQPKF